MRASLQSFVAVLAVLGLSVSARAIEPVGSASRGTGGESSRRAAAVSEPTPVPAAVAAKVQSAAKTLSAAPAAAFPQSATSAQLAAAPLPPEPTVAPQPVAPQSVAALTPTARAGGPFGWQTNVEEACRVARQHNLPVLVFVTSAHCPYCTKMKEQTFRSTSVIKEVDANFIPLRIERGSNPALERQLGIKSYPTTVVLRGDKAEMARMAGFIPPPQFLGNLKKIESQWPVLSASRPTTRR